MTVELYHHGTSVCAARVRLAIAEKHVHIDRYHYVDILKGEQYDPAFLALNPNAVVPVLVHDGQPLVETSLISLYLDEVFDGPALQPVDSYARYRMRHWLKVVDELLHPACSEVTYVACHRHIINRLPPDERERNLEQTPERSVKGAWRARKRELVERGFAAAGIDSHFRLYDTQLARVEDTLATGPWLIDDRLTLADLALLPYINRLDMLGMSALWRNGRRPGVARWFSAMQDRASFAPSLTDCCPPELAADMRRYGNESWPEAAAILGIA